MDTGIGKGIGAVGTLLACRASGEAHTQWNAAERASDTKRAELALRRSILRKLLRRLRDGSAP